MKSLSSLSRTALGLPASLAAVVLASVAANADTTYVPSSPNGQKVYLSRACHDPDLGSNCSTNLGCDGYDENNRSRILARHVKDSLLDRGYRVRIGDNGVSANVTSSNNWNATMHIPLHSNVNGSESCVAPVDDDTRGTETFYTGPNGRELAREIKFMLANESPGLKDRNISTDAYYELNTPDAVNAYVESEYHDWARGVDWLRDESWADRIAAGVDRCRGFPREGLGTTGIKYCTW